MANNSSLIFNHLTRAFLVIILFCSSIMYSQTGLNDATFDPGTGANAVINSTTLQSDGKILISGGFITYNGTSRKYIARVNTDGTLDATFNPGTGFNTTVYKAAQLSTGKILAVGQFTTFGASAAKRIVRLNANGTIDNTFNTGGAGLNTYAYTFIEQPDGKILISGGFFTYNGTTKRYITRLTSTGALDNTFNAAGLGANNAIHEMCLQPDGKIIIGGLFTLYNSQALIRLARINPDGSVDATFNTGTGITGSPTTTATAVQALAIQPDGKVLVGGSFTNYNGTTINNIMRLNTNGTIDNTFTTAIGANSYIRSIIVQADGKILVAGAFSSYNGTTKSRIMRLNADGTIDPAFGGSGTNFTINSMALQTDKNLIIGGDFANYDGTARVRLARVVNACPTVTASLTGNTNNLCSTGATGTATASATGGFSFTYAWSPIGGSSAVATGLAPGTYTCTISNECANTGSITATITAPSAVTVSTGTNSTICGGSTATLSASASGGTGAFTYGWMPGSLSGSNPTVTPSSTTVYTATATDANGCTSTANETINVSGVCATSSVVCGLTFNNLNSLTSASAITGAQQYRFKFYDNITNALVTSKTQASRTVTFSTISNLHYGKTYKWTVSVDKGLGFGTESNPNCTVSFGPAKTTVPCGNVYANFNTYTTCQLVGGATNYRFTFYNSSTMALVAVKTQTSNYIYFNQVPGLIYGNTYKWTVEAEYDNGGTGSLVFGPASSNTCTITFSPPQTTVPCGNTYAQNGYSGLTPVTGALGYRWTFYDATTMALVATKTNTTQYVYFNQVPGLVYNKAYKWTVEVQYNNGSGVVYGPASSNTCTMNYGTPGPLIHNPNQNEATARLSQQSIDGGNQEILADVFPNPTKDKITVAASEAIKTVKIYNISNQLVLATEKAEEIDLTDLKPGLYFINVETENGLKHLKIVKE